MPIVFLLLFVFVFGGTLGAGLGGASGRSRRVRRLRDARHPGASAIASAAQGTAIAVAMDMTRGHHRPVPHDVDRPRVGAHRARRWRRRPDDDRPRDRRRPSRCSSVSGPTRTSSSGSPRSGVLAMASFALSGCRWRWVSSAKSVEAASNTADAADPPAVLRQRLRADRVDARRAALVRRVPAVHADHRHRCAGCSPATAIGISALLAVAWCAAIALVGYVWARRSLRTPSRALSHCRTVCSALPRRRARRTVDGAQRLSAYSLSRPRLMIVFWISLVPSPMSRNGASRMSRSISYSLE